MWLDGVEGTDEHLWNIEFSLKVKFQFYNTVVRPAMMYGSEYWAWYKMDEIKMKVVTNVIATIRMFMLMHGVTSQDKIRNYYIWGSLGLTVEYKKCGRIGWDSTDVFNEE